LRRFDPKAPSGRLDLVDKDGAPIFVDYATSPTHSPSTLMVAVAYVTGRLTSCSSMLAATATPASADHGNDRGREGRPVSRHRRQFRASEDACAKNPRRDSRWIAGASRSATRSTARTVKPGDR